MSNERAVKRSADFMRQVMYGAQRRRPKGFTMHEADELAALAQSALERIELMEKLFERANERLAVRKESA